MNLSTPIRSVIPSAHGSVLAVLARTDAWLGSAQVTELLAGKVSRRRVADVLAELVDEGLVERDLLAARSVFRLNRVHLAAPAIVALAGLRGALFDLLEEHFTLLERPVLAVWVFGSAARGDGDSNSDIDLLVVIPDDLKDDEAWLSEVQDLSDRVSSATGNACHLMDLTESEFKQMILDDERLVSELLSDAVLVHGQTVRQMVRGARA